jgi:exonuclease SbcD
VQDLSGSFRRDAVNLLLAHTHLDGSVFGESERRIHLGDDWAAAPQALPASAQYVALGHIHKPQRVETAPGPAYYAGSPLQLDFGEAGQRKVFLVVEARPGLPARVEQVPYEGGKPLQDLRLTLQQLDEQRGQLLEAGWLRITVPLEEPDPDLARKVRGLVPNAVVVHAELPERPALEPDRPAAGATPVELYQAYHLRRHGEKADEEVEAGFQALYQEAGGEDHAAFAAHA